jgi:hypothetical protein
MDVELMQVDRAVRSRLGRRGLAEVAANLWIGDCQTCGRKLDGPPAASVDDMTVMATVSLHHPRCRASEWNDSGLITQPGGTVLTHVAQIIGIPGDEEGSVDPLLLVNPGLEQIRLRRTGKRWEVATVASFVQNYRLSAARNELAAAPSPHLTSWLLGNSLYVQCPEALWSAPIGYDVIAQAIANNGGVMVAVTTVLDPNLPPKSRTVGQAVSSGEVAIGWATLDTTGAPSDALLG